MASTMWRNHLNDVGLLYSLVDDLQAFWRFKALEWDKIERKIQQVAREEKRAHVPEKLSPNNRLREILENNNDYQSLRNRLDIEIHTALEIAHFLGYSHVAAIEALSFDPPLPQNSDLELAIAEAEALAQHAQGARYWWRMVLAAFRHVAPNQTSH